MFYSEAECERERASCAVCWRFARSPPQDSRRQPPPSRLAPISNHRRRRASQPRGSRERNARGERAVAEPAGQHADGAAVRTHVADDS